MATEYALVSAKGTILLVGSQGACLDESEPGDLVKHYTDLDAHQTRVFRFAVDNGMSLDANEGRRYAAQLLHGGKL